MNRPLPYHEVLIDALTIDLAQSRARVADLERDVIGYRDVARAALDQLTNTTIQLDRYRAAVYELRDIRRRRCDSLDEAA